MSERVSEGIECRLFIVFFSIIFGYIEFFILLFCPIQSTVLIINALECLKIVNIFGLMNDFSKKKLFR